MVFIIPENNKNNYCAHKKAEKKHFMKTFSLHMYSTKIYQNCFSDYQKHPLSKRSIH